MKGVAYAKWEQWILVAFGSRPPNHEEWNHYTAFLREASGYKQRGLLLSNGGSLEPYQRKEADAILGSHRDHDRRLAVVTASTFTRGFVKALSLFDPAYKAFSPREMDGAFAYLEVPESSRTELTRIALVLSAEVQ